MLDTLPREIQWLIVQFVGWTQGDVHELHKVVRRFKRHHTTVSFQITGPRMYYKYCMPKWCARCGEYRPFPCIKCTYCNHTDYHLISWASSAPGGEASRTPLIGPDMS